jgi:DnaJ family protein C protein 8
LTVDPYAILSLPHSATQDEIKKQYRLVSKQIHPDKTKLPNAPRAFDILKKAESLLMNSVRRANIDDVYKEAQLQSQKEGGDVEEIYKELLIKDEFQKRMNMKREMERQGAMDKKMEEKQKVAEQRKVDGDKWEGERDQRVQNWRNYTGKVDKKKKKKKKPKMLA